MNNQNNKNEFKGNEKRNHSRSPFRYPIFCTRLKTGEAFNTSSSNISFGGLMFISQKRFDINEQFNIGILYQTFNSKDKILIESKVVWVEECKTKEDTIGYLVGLQFQGLNEKQKTILNKIVNANVSF